MRQDLTEIACIIDRSGSMASIANDAIGGFNTFLEAQKAFPGKANFTLILFNHEYKAVHQSVDIQSVWPLDTTTYIPIGQTALLDAIGRTMDDLGGRLSQTPEEERPHKVVIAILTDGQENSSSDYTRERISQMIQHQREEYSWEFVFLAANQDAFATAKTLSIPTKDAFNFAATGQGVKSAYADMTRSVTSHRR